MSRVLLGPGLRTVDWVLGIPIQVQKFLLHPGYSVTFLKVAPAAVPSVSGPHGFLMEVGPIKGRKLTSPSLSVLLHGGNRTGAQRTQSSTC